jgi:hypothetical protein
MFRRLPACLVAMAAVPCLAQMPPTRTTGHLPITGEVVVSDGDTITINRVRVRLAASTPPRAPRSVTQEMAWSGTAWRSDARPGEDG